MPQRSRNSSQSTKMRKKRAAARAAKVAAAPPAEPEVFNTASAVFNPAPATMPKQKSEAAPTSDWDAMALGLLKRLGKRDATTRLRALTELHAHLSTPPDASNPSNGSNVASAFLGRLSEVFPALLCDGHPRARVGALKIAELVATGFKAGAKRTLRAIVPHWVAARADNVPTVSAEAQRTVQAAFEGKQATLVAFTEKQLVAYCYDRFGDLYSQDEEQFRDTAARLCAVIQWAIAVRPATLGALAEFVDDARRPLSLIATGLHAAGGLRSAPDHVARLYLALVRANNSVEEKRLEFAAEVVLACLPKATEVWELLLVIFAQGCGTDAFGHGVPGLEDALVNALKSNDSQPVDALLPLFAAMPKVSSTMKIAMRVLQVLRDMLGVNVIQRTEVPVAYTLAVAPAYLECVRFVLTKGVQYWVEGATAADVRQTLSAKHVAPFAVAVFVGDVLPVAIRVSGSNAKSRRALKAARQQRDRRVVQELAKTLAALEADDAIATVSNTPAAFLSALGGKRQSAVLLAERYAALLAGMPNSLWARTLAAAIVDQIVHPVEMAIIQSKGETTLALIRVLAESVHTVPNLFVDDQTSIRPDCAKYAVDHAEVDPESAGIVIAWAGWRNFADSGNTVNTVNVEQVIATIAETYVGLEHIIFETVASIVRTHATARQTHESCNPLQGMAIEMTTAKAARTLQTRGEQIREALELLSAVTTPQGGAQLLTSTHEAVLLAVADCVRKSDADVADCVRAIISLNEETCSAPPHLGPFIAAVIAWGGDLVPDAARFLKRYGRRDDVMDAVLDEMESVLAEAPTEKEDVLERTARNWKIAVDELADDDVVVKIMLHQRLLSRIIDTKTMPVDMLEYLLEEVEPADVFGGTSDDTQVEPDLLIPAFRLLCTRDTEQAHIGALEVTELVAEMELPSRVAVAACATEQVVLHGCADALRLLAATVLPTDETLDVESVVANVVQQAAGLSSAGGASASGAPRFATLVIEVVEIVTACSARRALLCLKPTLEDAAAVIRRDASSERAQFAAMLLCAAWAPAENALALPTWLVDANANALRAVRSFLQSMHLMRDLPKARRKQVASAASATGSLLLARALQVQGVGAVREEDWRFWPRAVLDALLDAQYADPTQKDARASIANLAALAVALVQAQENAMVARELKSADVQEIPVRIDSDALCANGAWAAVNFLPEMCADDDTHVVPVDPAHLARLVELAVLRGVLVNQEAEIPLSINKVFALVPLLDAAEPGVRQAVVSVLVRVVGGHLEPIIAQKFPKDGFENDEDEVKFAASIIPEPLRRCIEWTEDRTRTDVGYYLGWRVFLDLIAEPKDGKPILNQDGEDISFQRMGIVFLRENDSLFEAFFKRCVAAVVLVPPEVRDKAMHEANALLENISKGTKLQGLQRAKEREREQTRRKKDDADSDEMRDDDLDAQDEDDMDDLDALRAAGTAFALALQRLPALSRQTGVDRLPHSSARAVEKFVEERVSRLLIAAEIDRVRAWGSFGGGVTADATLTARGSVAGREVTATYSYSDVELEIALVLPPCYPLQFVEVQPRSSTGMSEKKWKRTAMFMSTVLRTKDGSVVEAVRLWSRNLDKEFSGTEECPICYSVLHINHGTLPRKKCRVCKHAFHNECLCKWFTKSGTAACPLCRCNFY